MQTKPFLAASLVLSLLVLACNRADQAPRAAASSPENQAMSTPSPNRVPEQTPSTMSPGSSAPSTVDRPQSSDYPPAKQANERKQSG